MKPTLVLALDGVPLRVILDFRESGAFADWTPARPLIAPFPSLTNVSFTAMLHVFDVPPSRGYEFLHFDRSRNRRSGVKVLSYKRHQFAWRDLFHSVNRTAFAKLPIFTAPSIRSKKELADAEDALFGATSELILAHVGSTNGMQVLRGDGETRRFLPRLTEWLTHVQRRHQRERGSPLRIVMLSDHGNSDAKVRRIGGIHRLLRDAGLRVVRRLRTDNDVVAPTFGLVAYGALYLKPDRARLAAEAVTKHPAVSLAVWAQAPREIRVASAEGEARILSRETDGERCFAYESHGADPLGLSSSRASLESAGRIDESGFATDRDWFDASLTGPYPDALHRLFESLTGHHVVNRANVIFSLEPGSCWGTTWANAIFWMLGSHLAGTHGGLDAPSSTGFFMTNDPGLDPGGALRAEWALTRLVRDRGAG